MIRASSLVESFKSYTNASGCLKFGILLRTAILGDCIPRAPEDSARCAVASTRTLTGRFLLKYSSSPLPSSFFERCIMNNVRRNSARMLASRKECHAQTNRSPQ